MSTSINPNLYCTINGCTRPRATGETVCSQHQRLARATSTTRAEPSKPDAKNRPPRCVVYMSSKRDVITIELAGHPYSLTLTSKRSPTHSDDPADLTNTIRP